MRERHDVTHRDDATERAADNLAERALSGGSCSACAGGESCGRPQCGHAAVPAYTVPGDAGAAIPRDLQRTLERGFGQSLDDIALHRGPAASALASELSAEAYTVGNHVVLGEHAPPVDSPAGHRMLAHEVAHVMQGADGPPIRRLPAPAATQLLVDESADPAPGQMRVDQFFAVVRPAVTAAANAVLARVGRTTDDCPYVATWLAFYEAMPAAHVERAALHYAKATPATAQGMISIVVERAVAAVERWVTTGEISGMPGSSDDAGDGLAVQRKADGATAAPRDASDAVARLGPGTALEAGTRAPMEAALGRSFSDVRVHTDARGAAAASALDARAFTVGRQIAFASGEYQPGTVHGDLLLAHELAHVAQQDGIATRGAGIADHPALEHEADAAAVAAALGGRASVQASGLKLQRCGKTSSEKDAGPEDSSAPAPKPAPKCVKPKVSVAMTGKMIFKGSEVVAVQPTDVAGELACEPFELRADRKVGAATYKAGTRVLPTTWDNKSLTVKVMVDDGTGDTFDTEKSNLRPATPGSSKVVAYDVGLEAQAKTLIKRQQELDDWDKTQADFKSNPDAWQRGHDELVKKRDASAATLNELEIRQFMYNRFDDPIAKLVAKANVANGFDKTDPLDPNVVKALMFQETGVGTAGPFLDDVSAGKDHDIINHYNLGQAIDSSAEMYARWFLQNDKARVTKFKLENILKDMHKAQEADPSLVGESFLWGYPHFAEACKDLWTSGGGTPLNKTYDHWIEMLIFMLFLKRKSSSSWAEAVRKYNGGGKAAKDYSKEVMARAQAAIDAKAAGKPFTPTRK